jgi:hypothetical protein
MDTADAPDVPDTPPNQQQQQVLTEEQQQQQVLTEEHPTTITEATATAAAAVVSSFLRKDSHLSSVQEQQVDQAFQDLFGYSWGTVFRFDTTRIMDVHVDADADAISDNYDGSMDSSDNNCQHQCSQLARSQRLLLRMLGPTAAAQIWRDVSSSSHMQNIGSSSTNLELAVPQQLQARTNRVSKQQQQQQRQHQHQLKPTVHRKQQHYKAVAPTGSNTGVASQPAVTAVPTNPQSSAATAAAASKTQTQTAAVTAVAPVTTGGSTTSTTAPAAAKSAAVGVDQLLNQIANGDDSMNVTTKTAADWETFKATAGGGLKDKLQEQALSKQAYLQRQDFLQRVDHRKFDLEKRERDQERSKRGK